MRGGHFHQRFQLRWDFCIESLFCSRNILVNASFFLTIWVAVIGSFLTIDARMGRVMKRGVLQNTWSSLQAHYSSIGGPARGLLHHKIPLLKWKNKLVPCHAA
jgi:hypothetical protein